MLAWTPVDLLPGLYAGALAILLWSGLRRWYDPVPVRVRAAFALVLLVLFGPVLFGGKLLLPVDNLRGHAPFQNIAPSEPHGNLLQGDLIQLVAPSLAAVRTELGEGKWPLWNQWVGTGMPLLADPQSQALQPIALAALPMPWQRAAAVMAMLRVLLALTFTYLWMRSQGLGEGPSLAGSLAFGLGGFLLLWLGWPIANSAALLPAVLYAVARCRRTGGKRDFLLLTITAFALLVGGHPETVLYSVGVAILFALTPDPSPASPTPSPREGRPHSPKLQFPPLPGRGRAGRRPVRERGVRGVRTRTALAFLIATAVAAPALLPALDYLPQTLRYSRLGQPVEQPAGDLTQHWLQIAAPNAYGNSRYVHYWGLNNTNEDAAGFVGTITLLAAILALGAKRRFPQERLFLGIAVACLILLSPWGADTRRLLLPLSFSLAYLAACTLERVRLGEIRRWLLILAAVGLGAVIAWGYLAHADPEDPSRLVPLRIGWLHWQGRFLVLGALILFFGAGRRWTAPAAAGLIAAELLLAHLPANPPMPKQVVMPVNGAIRFLQDNLKEGRMAALGRDFPPNLPSLYGFADIRVYNPMAPAEYLRRLEPILAGWWGELPMLGNPGHPLYRELGVRFILTAPGAQLPVPVAFQDENAWIYEVPGPRPPRADEIYRPRTFLPACLLAALGLAAGAAWLVPKPRAPTGPTRSAAPE